VRENKPTPHLSELLLAAPDINAELFRSVIAPRLAEMQGTRTTIYASSSDLALRASKLVHGYRRVGETIGGVFTHPPLDTIDASSASPIARAYGHSYLLDSLPVVRDIQSVLKRVAAKERGLKQGGRVPNTYWSLP
jgi:esterase/lipase superfamily enzyme